MMATCIHCNTRPVMDKPNAKVCLPCFTFGMARVLDDEHIIPSELEALPISKIARIFGDRWDVYAMKCYAAVVAGGTS